MGNAVMKYRKERMQRRAQQAGRVGLIANAFLSAGKNAKINVHAPITAGTTPSSRTGISESCQQPPKIEQIATSSSWKRPFQKVYRQAEDIDAPTQSFNDQRSTRQAERQKLALEEAKYGTAPANIDYDCMLEIDLDVTCVMCKMVKNDMIHECRICGRCYHQSCLQAGGYCNDLNFATSLKNSEEEVGWSCSECESIGSLLSMEEMDAIMEKFDSYDKNGDSKISWTDYRAVEKSSGTESSVREKFFQYDSDGDGIVSWENYLIVEALDILEKQPQVQLIMHLSTKEIERIKNCFRMKDDHNIGVISVAASAEAYYNWLKSHGLESSKEGRDAQELMYNPINQRKLITWERFIRHRALAIISARPNTATIEPLIRGHPYTAL